MVDAIPVLGSGKVDLGKARALAMEKAGIESRNPASASAVSVEA